MASLCVLLLSGTASAAPLLGYVQATTQYQKDKNPNLYQPMNMLDGKDTTAWCSGTGNPLGDRISFGFKQPVKIDGLKISTGNGFAPETFSKFGRPRKFTLKGLSEASTFTVPDRPGPQTVELRQPVEGSNFTLEILDLFPADDAESPACISEIVLLSKGKPLSGAFVTSKLKVNRKAEPFWGTWYAGSEGAPDRFLTLYWDGTYKFENAPPGEGDRKVLSGKYEVSGKTLRLSLGRKSATLSLANKEGGGRALAAAGKAGSDFEQPFREQP